jgi:hypothetical protein
MLVGGVINDEREGRIYPGPTVVHNAQPGCALREVHRERQGSYLEDTPPRTDLTR